jgi:hypothetical protein
LTKKFHAKARSRKREFRAKRFHSLRFCVILIALRARLFFVTSLLCVKLFGEFIIAVGVEPWMAGTKPGHDEE